MESYAFFYGYDDVDFYGPLLSSQYFNEIENGEVRIAQFGIFMMRPFAIESEITWTHYLIKQSV